MANKIIKEQDFDNVFPVGNVDVSLENMGELDFDRFFNESLHNVQDVVNQILQNSFGDA